MKRLLAVTALITLLVACGPQRPEGRSPWNIAWITDTQALDCEWITALVDKVKANKPSMIIHTGDARIEWANICAWKEVRGLQLSQDPPIELHMAPGNHDDVAHSVLKSTYSRAATEGQYLIRTMESDGKPATKYVSGPLWNPEVAGDPRWKVGGKPPYRYVFRRGNIRFIVLDVYASPATAEWVREYIVKPDDSEVTIILQHEHIVDHLAKYFEGLEGKHNVKLVLTGHDHHFLYEERHGVTFITGAGIATGHWGENDAMTLWVFPDHLRLDRYFMKKSDKMPPVEGPETVWSLKGNFGPYVRPDF